MFYFVQLAVSLQKEDAAVEVAQGQDLKGHAQGH